MIINIDQTPLKYVPTSNFTLADKEATFVTMESGTDKKMDNTNIQHHVQ